MTRPIRIKGFHIFRDRHGKWRCYHRETRTAVDLVKAPIGSAEFLAKCAQISALKTAAAPPKPGTLGMLIAAYRSSAAFTDLAPRTRADYQRIFDYLRAIDDTPLARFDRPLVVGIRAKAAEKHGRRSGNYVKAVLSLVFSFGVERGYLATNPAKEIKNIRRRKDAPEANRPWSDEERHVVLDAAAAHMRPALALMMYTGLAPKDALALPRSALRDGEIATLRAKTGEPVFWPAPAALREVLAEATFHDATTLCANSLGRPWTEAGFRCSWAALRKKLEKEGRIGSGLTLYGLRHTVAVILREAGLDERSIADALGQKTIEMARHYAKGADLTRKMRGVVASFDAEVNKRRSKVVQMSKTKGT
jgi:Site-specific recombinase XerD